MRKAFPVLLVLLALWFPAFSHGQVWEDSVRQVDQLYTRGLFNDAELAAFRLLNGRAKLNDVQRAELHRVLAFISIARDDRNAGKEQFVLALKYNPRMYLDPALTSPKIYAVFEEAKKTHAKEKLGEKSQRERDVLSYRLRVEGGIRSLMFPGLGQMHKGQKIKGVAFLSLAGASAVGLAYSHLTVIRKDANYHDATSPAEAERLYGEYRDVWRMRNVFAYSLAATWIAGVLDAFIVPPSEDKQLSLSLVPFTPLGGSAVVSVSLRFNL